MTSDIQPPAVETPAPRTKNVFERIAGVLFAPAETFADIARHPDILAPTLMIIIIGYACTAMVMPKMDFTEMIAMQSSQMRKQNPNIGEEQLAQIERISIATAKVFGWLSPIILTIWYAIVAGALLLAFKIFGGQGTYKQAFSTTLYAWMPLVLFSILMAIIVMARGTFDVTTAATLVKSNPAFLVDMKEQPVLFSLLSALDLFTIWTVVLLIIGFATMTRTSIGKAAAIVLSLWTAMIVVKLGFAALGASRMKA